ncbi:MAG: beta-lactamase family protein [Phycisphaeraceae bacterium]|nr:beta-lactamase family protein [Phycisphaeraceae bacterium]
MANNVRLYRFVGIGLLSLLVTTVLSAKTVHAQTIDLAPLDSYIDEAITDWKIPGLAIAIIKNDRVVHQKGYGTRQIGARDPVNKQTLFAIASNTKAFTATALGLLVQGNKLAWDDPVLKVMPEFQLYDPLVTRKIAIRDLLCHRSGLGLWTGDLTWWDSNYDRAEVIRRIRFQKPVSDFRTAYHYTNLMFLVAGEIIPQVTGISWDQFIKQRFFDELNMNRSNTSVKDLLHEENVATPHALLNGKLVAIDYLNVDNCAPAATINSSVEDLSHWVRLQLNNGLYDGRRLVD